MRSIKRAMNKLILNAVADCYLLCDLHCMIRKKVRTPLSKITSTGEIEQRFRLN
jgi:hypothetical protein